MLILIYQIRILLSDCPPPALPPHPPVQPFHGAAPETLESANAAAGVIVVVEASETWMVELLMPNLR